MSLPQRTCFAETIVSCKAGTTDDDVFVPLGLVGFGNRKPFRVMMSLVEARTD